MGILVNAIDMGLSGTRDVARRAMSDMMFRYEGEHTIRIRPPDRIGARKALTDAERISREHGSIQKMRVYGHGGPGVQSMGRGDWSQVSWDDQRSIDAANSFDAISFANVDSLFPELARLARCFAPDGVFEFHGCSVGAGPQGTELVRKMARYLGVPVFAGAVVQYSMGGAQPSQASHQHWDLSYEGNVRGASPSGDVGMFLPMGQRVTGEGRAVTRYVRVY